MSSDQPLFLDVDDVLELHAKQLEIYGGEAGLRDPGLLESAVAQPQSWFGGAYVHDGIFGNKRVGLRRRGNAAQVADCNFSETAPILVACFGT